MIQEEKRIDERKTPKLKFLEDVQCQYLILYLATKKDKINKKVGE